MIRNASFHRWAFVLTFCLKREHESYQSPVGEPLKNMPLTVAFSIRLWHGAVLPEQMMTAHDISPLDGWCGMALVARLQVAAGSLAAEKHRSNDPILRGVAESVDAIDWPAVPVIEFIVARSLVARFLCEIANRQSCSLLPSTIVIRLESVPAERFNETVTDAIGHLLVDHQLSAGGSNMDSRVQAALELIRSNCERRVRIDELAATVGLSRWHLERLTRKYTGASPREHLAAARMERAVALLAQRRLSIKELAFRLGYGNASAFTRNFRKRYGAPPRTWLRSH